MVDKRFSVALVAVVTVLLIVRVPLASGQDTQPVKVEFTAYEGNPNLDVGPSGAWDDGAVFGPKVVLHDGLYHMLYTGARVGWSPTAIGYATSADGLTWEKYASNPVFGADDIAVDAADIQSGAVLVEGDTWVLYYEYGVSDTPRRIGRATAPGPIGPWTRSEDLQLAAGSEGEWDAKGLVPVSVTASDEGYFMYYMGGDFLADRGIMVGLATSPDGITWTKYDDPATADPPYAESDPVLQTGLEGWRMDDIVGSARPITQGWEMFYSEKGWTSGRTVAAYRIGYATSSDGVHWTKFSGFPVLSDEDDPAGPFSYDNLRVMSVIVSDSTYCLYYDYLRSTHVAIGVATGTIARE
jgi:hypothetical protein